MGHYIFAQRFAELASQLFNIKKYAEISTYQAKYVEANYNLKNIIGYQQSP